MMDSAPSEAARAGRPEDFGQAAEAPSGKGAGDENFPVGSWLLPARLRPHVAKFYAFARAIDDIADSPDLAPEDKLRRLARFEDALTGRTPDDPALATAHRLRASLADTGVGDRHGRDLIAAFKQDAVKGRYDDWADLMAYCARSANPVGRYLLDLHGEDPAGYPASDALCSALQVINHLQDCGEDHRGLDRVYLPGDWLAAAGVTVEALAAPASSAGLRRVLDRCLDGTEELLGRAEALPGRLTSRRLALEAAVILALARRLVRELRARDPLAERVVLSKVQALAVAVPAVLGALLRRPRAAPHDHTQAVTLGSGSSFLLGMRLLPAPRRAAMYAIYAFCREVDDIADGPEPVDRKLAALQAWRAEIEALYRGAPTRPTTQALGNAITRYGLPKAEFLAIVDGMEMDARETMVAPERATFTLYCRRVAGAVGCLSLRAFGAVTPETEDPAADELAVALGEALQITNVLRDLDEDAARGRLYLPADLLAEAGLPPGPPAALLAHPALATLCDALAAEARARFAVSARLIAAAEQRASRRTLGPARVMMQVYRRLLLRLECRGWEAPRHPVRVSRPEKVWIALRHGLL